MKIKTVTAEEAYQLLLQSYDLSGKPDNSGLRYPTLNFIDANNAPLGTISVTKLSDQWTSSTTRLDLATIERAEIQRLKTFEGLETGTFGRFGFGAIGFGVVFSFIRKIKRPCPTMSSLLADLSV